MPSVNTSDSEDDGVDDEIRNVLNELIDKIIELDRRICKICFVECDGPERRHQQQQHKITPNVYICDECYRARKYLRLFELQRKNYKRLQNKQTRLNGVRDTGVEETNSQPTDEVVDTRRITRNLVKQQKQQHTATDEQHEQLEILAVVDKPQQPVVSRRSNLFKQTNTPKRCEANTACRILENEFVFHNGVYLKVDDIVALIDESTKKKYYAQIRTLLTDEYTQKYAIITWLLPLDTQLNEPSGVANGFNENCYVLGPTEEYPRRLDCMEFVKRPQCNYFRQKHLVYDTGGDSTTGHGDNVVTVDALRRVNLYSIRTKNGILNKIKWDER